MFTKKLHHKCSNGFQIRLLPVTNKKNESSYVKNLKLYDPFLCLKATGSLREGSLLFTTHSLCVPGTHLINFDGMKGWNNLDLEANLQIWAKETGLGIQRVKHKDN